MHRADHGPDQEIIRARVSILGRFFLISLPYRRSRRPSLVEYVTPAGVIL